GDRGRPRAAGPRRPRAPGRRRLPDAGAAARQRSRLARRPALRGGWQRLRRSPLAVLRLAEGALVPGDVAPGSGLPADPAVDADLLETERLVQPDARGVRERDPGARDPDPLGCQAREQLFVQRPPDATAARAVCDVDADVGRPAVAG